MNEHDFDFNTFDDKVLESMLKSARESLINVLDGDFRWLTFSGPTEVGKTHLIKGIRDFLRSYNSQINLKEKSGFAYYKYSTWPQMFESLLDKTLTLKEIENTGAVFIEEFLANNFVNQLEVSKAQEVLNCRLGKFTVIDTNKSLTEIQKTDPRIASRLLRNNGVLVDIPSGTKGYLLR